MDYCISEILLPAAIAYLGLFCIGYFRATQYGGRYLAWLIIPVLAIMVYLVRVTDAVAENGLVLGNPSIGNGLDLRSCLLILLVIGVNLYLFRIGKSNYPSSVIRITMIGAAIATAGYYLINFQDSHALANAMMLNIILNASAALPVLIY
jgi:hypothetical protein